MITAYNYLEEKTSKKVATIVNSQINLGDNAERVWVNPLTGVELSNYDYSKTIIKEALDGCIKKDDTSVADKIVNFFETEHDFKYIDFDFNDNGDKTYTINISTNLDGYKEYRYGSLEWDDDQKLYVLWTGTSYSGKGSNLENSSDEGISYYDSLQETQDAIKDEITDYYLECCRWHATRDQPK